MITDRSIFLDLMRGGRQGTLRLCHRQVDDQWVLIENNGRQPPAHAVADSVISGKLAAWAIGQGLVIDMFAGRHGKYDNHIYHLAETVPPETLAYIERRFPLRG